MEDFNLSKVLMQSAVHFNNLVLFSDPPGFEITIHDS